MKGWRYVLTYGYSLDIYARGDQRKGVNRKSGKVFLRYPLIKEERRLIKCQR